MLGLALAPTLPCCQRETGHTRKHTTRTTPQTTTRRTTPLTSQRSKLARRWCVPPPTPVRRRVPPPTPGCDGTGVGYLERHRAARRRGHMPSGNYAPRPGRLRHLYLLQTAPVPGPNPSLGDDDDMLTPTGYPPPNTPADMAHSTHSTQLALRPHRATLRAEDKPPLM